MKQPSSLPSKTKKANKKRTLLIAFLMILLMTTVFWTRTKVSFQQDSESLVVSMLAAQRYDLDVSKCGYGLGLLYPEGTTGDFSVFVDETYDAYYHGVDDSPYSFTVYNRQIGLQGWAFYSLSAIVPHALSALRLVCCIALAGVVTAVSIALNRRYGLLFSICFYCVTLVSAWAANFAPNLYWVPFTWFIPLLLGIVCVNHPNRRALLLPLFALSVFIKSACGYEYLTAILLGAILFPAVEWILSIKADKALAKRWFFTTLWIGVSCLIGFFAAFSVHALIRGSGDLLVGIRDIIQNDALRRTFGSAGAFAAEFTPSLNASVVDVLKMYFSPVAKASVGQTLFWLTVFNLLLLGANGVLRRKFPLKDVVLLVGGWLVGASWLILAKAHSFDHTYMNPVLWYLAFAQVTIYIAIRQTLIFIREPHINRYAKPLLARIEGDAYADL